MYCWESWGYCPLYLPMATHRLWRPHYFRLMVSFAYSLLFFVANCSLSRIFVILFYNSFSIPEKINFQCAIHSGRAGNFCGRPQGQKSGRTVDRPAHTPSFLRQFNWSYSVQVWSKHYPGEHGPPFRFLNTLLRVGPYSLTDFCVLSPFYLLCVTCRPATVAVCHLYSINEYIICMVNYLQ